MKFMHISDVHLGVKPDADKAWSEKRAQDIWDSFAEMIEIAAEESPDFLLISGDLGKTSDVKYGLDTSGKAAPIGPGGMPPGLKSELCFWFISDWDRVVHRRRGRLPAAATCFCASR